MFAKTILVFCAQALLAQAAFGQCAGRLGGRVGSMGLAGLGGCNSGAGAGLTGGYSAGLTGGYSAGLASGYGAGYGCDGVASTGGGLSIFSGSPGAPVGLTVVSENAYEGVLSAGGNLPFLGTVGIEGVLPTSGTGAVSYGCGDGAIGINSEGPIATGIASGSEYAPSVGLASSGKAGLGGIGRYGLSGISGNGIGGASGCGLGVISGYGLGGASGCGLGGISGYGFGGASGCGLGGISGYGLGGNTGCGCGGRN